MKRLDRIKNALLSVSNNVGHYRALKKEPPYFVWAEDTTFGEQLDNHLGEQNFQGTIDLFTLTENDPLVEETQNALNNTDCAWSLNTIQFEEDTGYIHYEWTWKV